MSTDTQLPPLSDAVSAVAFHPTNPNLLATASWDRHVYLSDITNPTSQRKLAIRGPILDVAWAPNSESNVFVGGVAKEVRSVDFDTTESRLIATHDEPVRCVEYSSELDAVISASWDATVRVTPLSTPGESLVLPVADKVYALALSKTKVIVAMAGRHVWLYDIATLKQALASKTAGKDVDVWQKRESSLKFMTRAIKAMPNDEGYATTSIEGRVAVEFFDPTPEVQAKKYAFKCHRQVIDSVDTVYPVQGLAFNPVHGTFATGGGDCTVSIWDPQAKKRLRQFPKYPSPISALEFNCDGTRLAVAFSEQDDGGVEGEKNGNGVHVRLCGDEVKPKSKA
ncbi:hypothetical protein ACM66B_003929 [Microbotryomycetes sp. NB124-2]